MARAKLLAVRALIFEIAVRTPGVGRITETIKWDEPAYLTEDTGSGSTIRLGWKPALADMCAVYFICHTHLVDEFQSMFRDELKFDGNRAILLDVGEPLPEGPLSMCLAAALTYHRNKKTSRRRPR